jgi:uncharacterized membrane protein
MKESTIVIILAFMLIFLGAWAQHTTEQRKAIKAGVAYYTSDEQGYSVFKYITEK